MTPLDRIHSFFDRLGISPKVAYPLIAGVVLFSVNGLVSGTFDVDALKLVVGGFVLTVFGVAAPPATGVRQRQVRRLSRR